MTGKISLVLNMLLAAAVIYLFTQIKKDDQESSDTLEEQAAENNSEETIYPSIAIVDNDSLAVNYEFRVDKSKILQKASADVQTLETRMAKAQEEYYEIMNTAQTVGFGSDAEIAVAEKRVQQLEADMPYLQSQMETKIKRLTKLEAEINDSLYSRLYRFIDSYTADKPIDAIFLYTKGMTGLYSNGELDITKEVVDGLNEAYREEIKE